MALTTAALIAWACDSVVGRALELERAALVHGQLWRLVTGHFAHWSADHLAWDLLVFAVVGGLLEHRIGRRRWLALLMAAALAIALAVLVLCPAIGRFRGLSGIDCALVVALATTMWCDAVARGDRRGAFVQAVLLLAYGVKTALELCSGLTVFVQMAPESFRAVPLAHVVGGVVGMLFVVGWDRVSKGAAGRPTRGLPAPPLDGTTRPAPP